MIKDINDDLYKPVAHSFFDEWNIVDEKALRGRWSGNSAYFRCALCGHKFIVEEPYIVIYTNNNPEAGGNPIVCGKHNEVGSTNEQSIRKLKQDWHKKCLEWDKIENDFWWFLRSTRYDTYYREEY